MRSLEATGPSIDQAVEAALKSLGVGRDEVEVQVLEEPNKGFLGLVGQRDARVLVTVTRRKVDVAVDFLSGVIKALGLPLRITAEENDRSILINLSGPNLGLLIGYHGQTLDALQYLVNLAANKASRDRKPVVLDCEGYRQRRLRMLEKLALRTAEKVRRAGGSISLEPMTASERRAIHLALQDNPYVQTHSEGEEPFRKVVVSPVD